MRWLNGNELAGYIKERQAKEVRRLLQSEGVRPKLSIILTTDNPVIKVYVNLKKKYGADILVDVDIHRVEQAEVRDLLSKLSKDNSVHAIIVQLPLADPAETDSILSLIDPAKDVDGLAPKSKFEPATALAIMWLLAGYNIQLVGKEVVLIGHGKLVGAPLEKLLLADGIKPTIIDIDTPNPKDVALKADVIITATGHHGVLTADMIKDRAVVVDAGVASEGGKTVGDVAADVYERDDLTITPMKGGVGPLTVCALFENVIRAAQRVHEQPTK